MKKLLLFIALIPTMLIAQKPQDLKHDTHAFVDDFANIYTPEQNVLLDPRTKTEAENNKSELLSCFEGQEIFVEEIPNGYYGDDSTMQHIKWFVVTTKIGRIKIGWRKRVINIDWSDTVLSKLSGEELFANVESTKGGKSERDNCYVHAYGVEKATEYVQHLLCLPL